jgi:hypothetical protein
VTDSRRWLDTRLAEAPESLRDSVRSAVDAERVVGDARRTANPRGFGGLLTAAAERLIAPPDQTGAPATRALALLTADALITLACEWAAEHDPLSAPGPC